MDWTEPVERGRCLVEEDPEEARLADCSWALDARDDSKPAVTGDTGGDPSRTLLG